MDVTRLFRRIRHLEACLKYMMNQGEKKCLYLFEPDHIEIVKFDRMISDYYDQVIKGQAAMTVEDIGIAKETLDLGL